MKAGVNKDDIIAIRELAEDGQDAESISMKLQIYAAVVSKFLPAPPAPAAPAPVSSAPKPTAITKPKLKPKQKPKAKPTTKAAAG